MTINERLKQQRSLLITICHSCKQQQKIVENYLKSSLRYQNVVRDKDWT